MFASYFRQRFIEERINKKTSWGKNELVLAYNEALLDAMMDLKAGKEVPEF